MTTTKFPTAHGLTVLRVPGGRFAEINHSSGHASVLIADDQSVAAGLFAAADEELAKATRAHKRAMLYRSAAWLSLKGGAK